MSDGAHLGVSASRALDTILGDQPSPAADEGMTREQMRAWLEQPDQPITFPDYDQDRPLTDEEKALGSAGYEESGRQAAKRILAYLDAHPDLVDLPLDDEIDADEWRQRDYDGDPTVVRSGVYTRMKADGISLADLGLSGFQAGWAMNAARYALGAPPQRNPALLEITQ